MVTVIDTSIVDTAAKSWSSGLGYPAKMAQKGRDGGIDTCAEAAMMQKSVMRCLVFKNLMIRFGTLAPQDYGKLNVPSGAKSRC